jgi:hypothetical protein
MKQTILAISLLAFFGSADAQNDSWQVFFNKKLIISATQENEARDKKIIDVSKPGNAQLTVAFHEAKPNPTWKRVISIKDENENVIFQKEGVSGLSISAKQLKKLAKGRTIKIVTWSLPKDPAQASLVRVRTIALCTLELR